MSKSIFLVFSGTLLATVSFWLAFSASPESPSGVARAGGENPIDRVIRERGLSPDEALAALKVFVPPGEYDEFVMVTSGGHRGTVILIGIPSMRVLEEIPVYAPDAWEGWAQGDLGSKEVLEKDPSRPGSPP